MRAVWGGFALGVWWLQQQAALPGRGGWFALVVAAVAAGAWSVWALAGAAVTERVRCDACDDRVRPAPAAASGRWPRRYLVRFIRPSGWLALWVAAACAGFGYASFRAQLRLADALPVAWQTRDIEITGYVAGLPSWSEDGARFPFTVESWGAPTAADGLPHTIQLTWVARDAPLPPLVPGARWRFAVRLKRPHGERNFGLRDAEAAMLARGVRATGYVSDSLRAQRLADDASGIGIRIERWRAAVRARIDTVLADAPHRGIVVALATGAQDAVSDADWRLMRNTGTSHLVAISGLHLAFVAGLGGWAAGAFWRRARWRGVEAPLIVPAQKIAVAGAVCAAGLHAALAGFNVPVQRALWMLAVAAVAVLSGRNVARSQVLAWALALVLIRDPWAVTAAGFWLSFGAVAAILFAAAGVPRVRRERREGDAPDNVDPMSDAAPVVSRANTMRRLLMHARNAARGMAVRLTDAARVQWAVTIALAPLTAYWFAQIPLIGPFANALAIPFVSALVTPAVLASVAIPAPFDAFILRAAHAMLDLLAAVLGWFDGVSWAVLRLSQPSAWALACAALGVAWCLAPRGWPLRWIAPFMWLPLLVPAPTGPPAGAFRLTALDVGQGTSVLVETARHTLLFDAGTGPESTHAGERIVVPYLQAHGVQSLDMLMVSHDDSDHSGGAPAVLDQVAVKQFAAGIQPDHPLWASARRSGAQVIQCAAGQRWHWDGIDFEVLWPDAGPLAGKPNARCCVLRVSTTGQGDATAALLAADIEAATERTLLARAADRLRAQVLVVPHHGSRTSSTEPFLDSVWPLVAIFQVGYLNRFHHPHPGVYARYAARHIVLTRSDSDGAVRVEARNGALAVERYVDTQRRYWMDVPDD
ncbi:DNA internalization-related competence protein ComEC/Rec2 [Paraburkholderia dinghuensis]|uniref:DNA internalization-related competence protein ComEC/Rec2 n=1 Tax=Paraburkholderia dinghuensis TaxID=2305225 RepID=A0A3N6MV83_9BURK|nr:DNA internalization-related competence protein ComEC/Rec2 [Paraburkholderia dinghuensis]RQH07818.1 DNA internalization-related competence protein ComEC/Rec2 [Paraburkholderia dinghuensis]